MAEATRETLKKVIEEMRIREEKHLRENAELRTELQNARQTAVDAGKRWEAGREDTARLDWLEAQPVMEIDHFREWSVRIDPAADPQSGWMGSVSAPTAREAIDRARGKDG